MINLTPLIEGFFKYIVIHLLIYDIVIKICKLLH